MIIIYALSGIGMNHLDDWNPRYTVETREAAWDGPDLREPLEESQVLAVLDQFGEREGHKKHYSSDPGKVKVFIKNGTVMIDLESGLCKLEKLNRRPLFFQLTFLHYNPKNFWVVEFADGIIQRETAMLLMSEDVRSRIHKLIFTSYDAFGAIGGLKLLKEKFNLVPDAVSGICSSSPLGIRELQEFTDLPILKNVQRDLKQIGEILI